LRALSNQRGYVALSVLTLALAVGANVVVFTIVNALWVRPRPVAEPERVVVISNLAAYGAPVDSITARRFLEVRASPALAAVAGQVTGEGLLGDFRPRIQLATSGRHVEVLAVTPDYFRVLGVPVRGRDFDDRDDDVGAPAAAIISERLWRSEFEGGQVIGQSIDTSYDPITIVGIAADDFRGARLGEQVDLWIPSGQATRFTPMSSVEGFVEGGAGFVPMIGLGRLAPGVTIDGATRTLNERGNFVLYPLSSVFGAPTLVTTPIREGRLLGVVAATSGLVLIAGCATLAALVLMHLERRRRELGIRLALGSTRARLARRLAAELSIVAALGVTAALAAAHLALGTVHSLSLPAGLSMARLDLEFDWRVIAVSLAVSLMTLLVAGLLPLARFTRPAMAGALTSSSATPARSSLRLRRVLLATHTGATIVVLVGAALFVRTVSYGFGAGAGFDVDHTVFLRVQPSLAQFPGATANPDGEDADRRQAAYDEFLIDLQTLPGVQLAAVGSSPIDFNLDVSEGRTVSTSDGEQQVSFGFRSGSPDFLAVLGIPLLAGEFSGPSSPRDAQRNAVATTSLAARLWPGRSPLGERIGLGRSSYTITGIVPDFAQGSIRSGTRAGLVAVSSPRPAAGGIGIFTFAVRTRGEATDATPVIRELLDRHFPGAARADVHSGRELLARDMGRQRLGASFFSGFGLVSFALGLAGVFGLVAYLAEARRREFGVRAALGATPGRLTRMAAGTGLGPVAAGTAAGLVIAGILAGAAEGFLFGVGRLDRLSYACAAALMLTGAAAAGLLAAWRIRRISPMDALRTE
jgi:predicted permease